MNLRPATTVALLAAGWLAAVPCVPAGELTPTPSPSQSVADQDDAGKTAHYPFAVPVRGKRGYVISPYAPNAGFVDVNGFKRGDEVRCPYTGKIFLVP